MKKVVLFILIFVLIAVNINLISAEDTRRYIVTYQLTNIRPKPSTSSEKIARVDIGKEFEIVGEETDSDGKVWFKIAYKPDTTAYVASWVVDIKTSKPPETVENLKVIIDPTVKVNIRSNNSTSSDVVLVVRQRQVFPILAQVSTPDLWYKIDIGDGKVGWVKAEVTKGTISDNVEKETVEGMVAHIKPLVNIREQPTTNSRKVTKTTSAIQPFVISKTTGADDGKIWYEIELPTNQIGWVRSDMATLTQKESATSIKDKAAIIPANLNIRKEAGTNHEILFKTKSEQKYPVLSMLPDVNGDIWYQVQTENDIGWVLGSYVKLVSTSNYNTVNSGAKLLLSPTEGSKLIITQQANERCGISGSAIDANGKSWYLVTTSKKTGWVVETQVTVKTYIDKPAIRTGETVSLQRSTKLLSAPLEGSESIKDLFKGATGTIKATALRDNNTLYLQIHTGDDIGWVKAETTEKHYEQKSNLAVDVGQMKHTKKEGLNEFTLDVSSKPEVEIKNYSDDPRIVMKIKNAVSTSRDPLSVVTSLISNVLVDLDVSEKELTYTFKLNRPAGYYLYPLTKSSKMIKLEIFEKPPENEIKLYIQGQPVFSSTPPINEEGAILVPLESIASRIGALVYATNIEKGIFELKTEHINLTFTQNKSMVEFTQIPSGHSGEDNKFYPVPRFSDDDDKVFYVPLEHLARHLNFKYYYYPQKNEIHLDPIVDKIEIGGCSNSSDTCKTIATNISLIADYKSEELSDGREKITINNTVLGENVVRDVDETRVKIETVVRTQETPSKVILYIVKKDNESISVGELKNPNRLIIQIYEQVRQGLSGKTIIIDPGHGNLITNGAYDHGCITEKGIKESDVSLKIAQSLQKILNEKGATVVLTRNSAISEDATLDNRLTLANGGGSHMFISIHTGFSRDPKMQGCRTFFYAPLGERLANLIQPAISKSTGFTNLGVFKRNYYMCRKISGIPSVLVEPFFLSNTQGESFSGNQKNIDNLSKNISQAIIDYFEEIP